MFLVIFLSQQNIEVSLKEETARLFRSSLTRYPDDADIHVSNIYVKFKAISSTFQTAVAKVVGRVDGKERHKVKMALKFCKAKLTEHRSEERRKVSTVGTVVLSYYKYPDQIYVRYAKIAGAWTCSL